MPGSKRGAKGEQIYFPCFIDSFGPRFLGLLPDFTLRHPRNMYVRLYTYTVVQVDMK